MGQFLITTVSCDVHKDAAVLLFMRFNETLTRFTASLLGFIHRCYLIISVCIESDFFDTLLFSICRLL